MFKESETFKVNKQLSEFSSNGKFLAIAFKKTLFIKNIPDFQSVHAFHFIEIIECIEWSPNNLYIICASLTSKIVQIFSLVNPEWKYKLSLGSCGLESVTWCPDSKNILTFSDFKIQITVWPLTNNNTIQINKLKSTTFMSAFSPNGQFFAAIISDDGNEYIEIYKTNEWTLSRKLICDYLMSIDGISWSPNNEMLCIWSSISGESKLVIYSKIVENHIGIFHADQNKNESEYNEMKIRGIECVKWMPSSQILAVAGHNEVIVLLNYLTWNPIGKLSLQPVLKENSYLSKVYKESVIKDSTKTSSLLSKHILEEISYGSINVPISKKDFNQPSVSKIDIFEFSFCGRYLTVRHQIYPQVLWIWHISTNVVDLFFLENEISAVRWSLKDATLFVFTESPNIFKWTPEKASCIAVPNQMNVLDCRCHPTENCILLCGYNKASIYHFCDVFSQ